MAVAGLSPFVFAPALLLAFVDWITVYRNDRRLEYVFKPAVMVAIILAVLLIPGAQDGWRITAFLIGFVFCLAGDVFLMIPQERFFIFGLVAFLLGHIGFIVGLNRELPQAAAYILLVPIALASVIVLYKIIAALSSSRQGGLVGPVSLYTVVISIMLWSAWATLLRPDWNPLSRVWVIIGAILFYISDAILAWNKFVRPFRFARLVDMVSYHLGQIALAVSLLY